MTDAVESFVTMFGAIGLQQSANEGPAVVMGSQPFSLPRRLANRPMNIVFYVLYYKTSDIT